jgi:hypothetical protein
VILGEFYGLAYNKAMKTELTQESLKVELHYDPHSGRFTRLVSRQGKGAQRGDEAGHICKTHGYRYIKVYSIRMPAHALAFLYMTGEIPPMVDHINGIRSDTRWENLRAATRVVNAHNHRRPHRQNKVGLLGVSKTGNRFRAQIMHSGKIWYLGLFGTAVDAHEAYLAAKRKFHEGNTL